MNLPKAQLRAIFRKFKVYRLKRGLSKLRDEKEIPSVSVNRALRVTKNRDFMPGSALDRIGTKRKEHADSLRILRAETGHEGARKHIRKMATPKFVKPRPVISYSLTAGLASVLGSTIHPNKSKRKLHRRKLKKALKNASISVEPE